VNTSAPVTSDAPVMVLSEISKRFGSAIALDNVSLSVRRGSVHALIGENGAGKTTLMRIAFGLMAADSGTVALSGSGTRVTSAAAAIAAGVGMVHQHFTNVPAMTVAENVVLGGRGVFDTEDANRLVAEIGRRSGLVLDPSVRATELSVGAQQRLEIVKALGRDARILILDEPTAVLAPAEADDLLRWLRRFADGGNSVVLITHKLREALAVADDITVLRRGRVVERTAAAETTSDALATALLGEEARVASRPTVVAPVAPAGGRVVASAHGVDILNDRGLVAVRAATFDIRAGEIVGIAAIDGAGQRELLRALARRLIVARGELRLPQSIGFVPEDRHRDSLVLSFSLGENVALRDSGVRRGRLDLGATADHTNALIREFDVRGGAAETPARALSGGNQQKFVLARELDGSPALLVVENPTRGLDIRATRSVRERLSAAAAEGAAVVLYSSDLDEVLAMATRVLVLHAGEVRESINDRDAVGRAMLGLR
jgi:ABC-type uncharacterized transport system ATPase subunit